MSGGVAPVVVVVVVVSSREKAGSTRLTHMPRMRARSSISRLIISSVSSMAAAAAFVWA
jgi:hypothetical protein